MQHLTEAREAVNALREEHERQRQARLLAEQQRRQMQMQMKLDVMRHKKHASYYWPLLIKMLSPKITVWLWRKSLLYLGFDLDK